MQRTEKVRVTNLSFCVSTRFRADALSSVSLPFALRYLEHPIPTICSPFSFIFLSCPALLVFHHCPATFIIIALIPMCWCFGRQTLSHSCHLIPSSFHFCPCASLHRGKCSFPQHSQHLSVSGQLCHLNHSFPHPPLCSEQTPLFPPFFFSPRFLLSQTGCWLARKQILSALPRARQSRY